MGKKSPIASPSWTRRRAGRNEAEILLIRSELVLISLCIDERKGKVVPEKELVIAAKRLLSRLSDYGRKYGHADMPWALELHKIGRVLEMFNKNLMTILAIAFLASLMSIGCHGQVPPATKHSVQLSWTAPQTTDITKWKGCAGVTGSATDALPCVYGVYKCTLSSSACGDTNNSAWTEITTSTTRPSALTYTDSAPSSGTNYYVVTTIQTNGVSGPSNIAPAVVPGVPVAPPLNSPNVADNQPPLLSVPDPAPAMAAVAPMRLNAALTQ